MMGRLEDLERMREVLMMALDGDRQLQGRGEMTFTEPAASVVRELRAVVRELEELAGGGEDEGSAADDIAARYTAGGADPPDLSLAARRSQPRRRGRGDRAG